MKYENLVEDYGSNEKLIEKITFHTKDGWRVISCSPYYFEMTKQGMQAQGWRIVYERQIQWV